MSKGGGNIDYTIGDGGDREGAEEKPFHPLVRVQAIIWTQPGDSCSHEISAWKM